GWVAICRRSSDHPFRRICCPRPCSGTTGDHLPYNVSQNWRTHMRFNEIAKRTGRAVALSAALVAAASLTLVPGTAYAQPRGGGGGGGFHGGGFHGGGFHGGGFRGGRGFRGGGWGWGWPVAAGLFAGAALASYP